MKPERYEHAVGEYLRLLYPEPEFMVRLGVKMSGKLSRGPRQIDAAVFAPPAPQPIFIAEAKMHRRGIDVGTAGMIISLVKDVGPARGVPATTSGSSCSPEHCLAHEGIQHLIITISRAECLQWISHLRSRFPGDSAFMEVSGGLIEAIRKKEPAPLLECDVPYEEWLAVADLGSSTFVANAAYVFSVIAREHYDAGHRFNAIQLLDEWNVMRPKEAISLLEREADPEVHDLLEQIVLQAGWRRF